MDNKSKTQTKKQVTIEEVNRVLEVGRILFSVLSPEEIEVLSLLKTLRLRQLYFSKRSC